MAIKDWKLTTRNDDYLVWSNIGNPFGNKVSITNVNMLSKMTKQQLEFLGGSWRMQTSSGKDEYFKSKLKAFKFAKSYMRTH